MQRWTLHYCLSPPQIDRRCSRIDMCLNMMLIRWLGWLSVPQHHRAWWRGSAHERDHNSERWRWSTPISHPCPSLWCGVLWMGAIMVIAIIPLLVIVVGPRQQIKSSGSILINCHCKGITESSSHTVAQPVLRVQWLTPPQPQLAAAAVE